MILTFIFNSASLAGMHRVGAALLVTAITLPAAASERHFTYTYESQVLNPGHIEIEPWTTLRAGREDYYQRYDLRLEFEFGVVKNLQTSLYWNFSAIAEDVEVPGAEDDRVQEFEFEGVSNEWKYKLSDSVADPLGAALYFEGTAAPAEAELEAKLILDKRIGPLLLAFNAVGEYEWEFEPGETEREVVLAPVAAFGYFVTPEFMAGVELRSNTEWVDGDYEHTMISAGPVAAYAAATWWSALTILPQITTLEGGRDLEDHEALEVRLLLGFFLGQ
jgi:hypothetical protein